jgi:ubiquinone/menaquinone biosynthesis C-methylase UbiE
MRNPGLTGRYYDCVFAVYDRLLYGRLARYYDVFFSSSPILGRARERTLEGLTSGCVLDVACGTGSLLAMAHARGLQCYGVDLSQGMLARARRKVPHAELRIGDFENLSYPDSEFDYVVCTNAIGSVKVNPRRVISAMLRVCRHGGEVRVADCGEPPRRTPGNEALIRLYRLFGDTPYDYRSIFRDLGYEADLEILGLLDTYQLLKVKKEHR